VRQLSDKFCVNIDNVDKANNNKHSGQIFTEVYAEGSITKSLCQGATSWLGVINRGSQREMSYCYSCNYLKRALIKIYLSNSSQVTAPHPSPLISYHTHFTTQEVKNYYRSNHEVEKNKNVRVLYFK